MGKITPGQIHKFLTGEIVDADAAPQGGALNPIFDSLSFAINDNDTRVGSLESQFKSQVLGTLTWDQVLPPISNMSRQAIINGNFDIWQRGTSFTNPGNVVYTSDRWVVNQGATGLPANVVHSRQALTPGDIVNSYYFYRINTDGAGTDVVGNNYILRHKIENGTRSLCGIGKKVTLSFYARSSIANKRIGVNLDQVYGTGGSPSAVENIIGTTFTLTPNWTKYTFTFTTNTLVGKTFGTNNDDFLQSSFWVQWGSSFQSRFGSLTSETFVGAGNIDIAQVQICSGDVALPFQPRSFAEELQLCQRYYESSYSYGILIGTADGYTQTYASMTGLDTGNIVGNVYFKMRKRVTPTMNFYAANVSSGSGTLGNVRNETASALVDITSSTIYANDTCLKRILKAAAFVTNNSYAFNWTADSEL